jgi:hypothetical protein
LSVGFNLAGRNVEFDGHRRATGDRGRAAAVELIAGLLRRRFVLRFLIIAVLEYPRFHDY